MAPATFQYFPLLPQDIQDDIWTQATYAPTVHSLELFAIHPFHFGWQEVKRRVQCIQQEHSATSGRHVPLHRERSLTPLIKLAIPFVFPDKGQGSGHDANSSQLARVDSAAYEAVTHAISTRARPQLLTAPLPQVYVDLIGQSPTIAITMAVEQDLVYLRQPMDTPCVWRLIAGHRRGRYEIVIDEDNKNWPLRRVHQGQTESIQHLLLDHDPRKYWRDCAGCNMLYSHNNHLHSMAYKRAESGTTSDGRACKMCRKVRRQLQLKGASADEATIREGLLKDRRMRVFRRAQAICTAAPDSIRAALRLAEENTYTLDNDKGSVVNNDSDADHNEDDDSDAVSICSNDANNDFARYNNSLHAFVVENIRSSKEIPPEFIDLGLPQPSHAAQSSATVAQPSPRPSSPSATTTPAPFSPLITRSQYHPGPLTPSLFPYQLTPRHGSHPNCNRVCIDPKLADNLPHLFPSAKSLLFLDHSIFLRPGISTLPAEGRRWYSWGGQGVYIEVVNFEDDCWVFGEGDKYGYGNDPVGVVELVRYLRGFYEKGLYWDFKVRKWKEGGERRHIEVGVVAYLELDDDGRVKAERSAAGVLLCPYNTLDILSY